MFLKLKNCRRNTFSCLLYSCIFPFLATLIDIIVNPCWTTSPSTVTKSYHCPNFTRKHSLCLSKEGSKSNMRFGRWRAAVRAALPAWNFTVLTHSPCYNPMVSWCRAFFSLPTMCGDSQNGRSFVRTFSRDTSQTSLQSALSGNRAWAAAQHARDPTFFDKLADAQHPEWLWIGCADSRVPVSQSSFCSDTMLEMLEKAHAYLPAFGTLFLVCTLFYQNFKVCTTECYSGK
jgi:hypothetical protein